MIYSSNVALRTFEESQPFNYNDITGSLITVNTVVTVGE